MHIMKTLFFLFMSPIVSFALINFATDELIIAGIEGKLIRGFIILLVRMITLFSLLVFWAYYISI